MKQIFYKAVCNFCVPVILHNKVDYQVPAPNFSDIYNIITKFIQISNTALNSKQAFSELIHINCDKLHEIPGKLRRMSIRYIWNVNTNVYGPRFNFMGHTFSRAGSRS